MSQLLWIEIYLSVQFLVNFSVEVGREKLRLGYEFDLPKFESTFTNDRLQRNPARHFPSSKSNVVILECVAKPPTFKDVAKTLVDKKLPMKETVKPKKEAKPVKKEKLRRIGLKQNSDDESDDSELSLSSSSERSFFLNSICTSKCHICYDL